MRPNLCIYDVMLSSGLGHRFLRGGAPSPRRKGRREHMHIVRPAGQTPSRVTRRLAGWRFWARNCPHQGSYGSKHEAG